MPRPVFVHLLPSLIPPGALRGGVAVVVDVLRATTVMVQALASGAEAVIPCLEVEEARQVASKFPVGSSILGGERRGLPIEGFDFGNSPASYTPEVCAGKTLVMTTTNGTRAILASLEADRVFIAAFSNFKDTLLAIGRPERPTHIVCAGTDGMVSLEDTLLAGSVVEFLRNQGCPSGNDEAKLARLAAWRIMQPGSAPLDQLIAAGRGGQRVREIGLEGDIADAAAMDGWKFAAELRREPLRIVRV